jgi:hypothetical protein
VAGQWRARRLIQAAVWLMNAGAAHPGSRACACQRVRGGGGQRRRGGAVHAPPCRHSQQVIEPQCRLGQSLHGRLRGAVPHCNTSLQLVLACVVMSPACPGLMHWLVHALCSNAPSGVPVSAARVPTLTAWRGRACLRACMRACVRACVQEALAELARQQPRLGR